MVEKMYSKSIFIHEQLRYFALAQRKPRDQSHICLVEGRRASGAAVTQAKEEERDVKLAKVLAIAGATVIGSAFAAPTRRARACSLKFPRARPSILR